MHSEVVGTQKLWFSLAQAPHLSHLLNASLNTSGSSFLKQHALAIDYSDMFKTC